MKKNRYFQIFLNFVSSEACFLKNSSTQILNISFKALWLSPDLFVQIFVTKRSSCSILPCHKLHRMIVLFEVNYQAAFTGTSLINSKCPSRHQNNAPTTDCDFSPTWLHTHQVPLLDSRCHPPEHWHQEVQWTEDVVCVGGEGDLQESEEKARWHPQGSSAQGQFLGLILFPYILTY